MLGTLLQQPAQTPSSLLCGGPSLALSQKPPWTDFGRRAQDVSCSVLQLWASEVNFASSQGFGDQGLKARLCASYTHLSQSLLSYSFLVGFYSFWHQETTEVRKAGTVPSPQPIRDPQRMLVTLRFGARSCLPEHSGPTPCLQQAPAAQGELLSSDTESTQPRVALSSRRRPGWAELLSLCAGITETWSWHCESRFWEPKGKQILGNTQKKNEEEKKQEV